MARERVLLPHWCTEIPQCQFKNPKNNSSPIPVTCLRNKRLALCRGDKMQKATAVHMKASCAQHHGRVLTPTVPPSSVLFSGCLPLFLPRPYISNERRSIIEHHVLEESADDDENADVIGLTAPPASPPAPRSPGSPWPP